MTLDPSVAKKILESEDGKNFARFLAESIMNLDTVRDLPEGTAEQTSIEVRARAHAVKKLEEMLGDLLLGKESTQPDKGPSEYAM